jgi:hypothetical protein
VSRISTSGSTAGSTHDGKEVAPPTARGWATGRTCRVCQVFANAAKTVAPPRPSRASESDRPTGGTDSRCCEFAEGENRLVCSRLHGNPTARTTSSSFIGNECQCATTPFNAIRQHDDTAGVVVAKRMHDACECPRLLIAAGLAGHDAVGQSRSRAVGSKGARAGRPVHSSPP